jgi:hypothetical protein
MDFPVEHLSASSINLFLRCPRQWQERYVFKTDEPKGEPLIVGSGAHLYLSRILMDEDPGDWWEESKLDKHGNPQEIVWKGDEYDAMEQAKAFAWYYYENIGKYLNVTATESEIELEVPGVPIPVVGYVDIETPERIIDVKTTGYLSRAVKLNPEWRLQAHIYQLAHPKPAEFHVLTRAKNDPLIVPGSKEDKLYIPVPESPRTQKIVQDTYGLISYMVSEYGEQPWPGNPVHEWASKYCAVENCCGRY